MSRYRTIQTDWEEFCPEGDKGPLYSLKLEIRYWLDRDFVEPCICDVEPVITLAQRFDEATGHWTPWAVPDADLVRAWENYWDNHPFTRDHIWQIVEAAVEDERSVAYEQ